MQNAYSRESDTIPSLNLAYLSSVTPRTKTDVPRLLLDVRRRNRLILTDHFIPGTRLVERKGEMVLLFPHTDSLSSFLPPIVYHSTGSGSPLQRWYLFARWEANPSFLARNAKSQEEWKYRCGFNIGQPLDDHTTVPRQESSGASRRSSKHLRSLVDVHLFQNSRPD